MSDTVLLAGKKPGQEHDMSGERMFTQEEVNRIVQERLSRVKTSEQELTVREQTLALKERMAGYREELKKEEIPEKVLEALNCTSEESFKKSLEILRPYFLKLKEPILNPVGPTGGTISVDPLRNAMGLK